MISPMSTCRFFTAPLGFPGTRASDRLWLAKKKFEREHRPGDPAKPFRAQMAGRPSDLRSLTARKPDVQLVIVVRLLSRAICTFAPDRRLSVVFFSSDPFVDFRLPLLRGRATCSLPADAGRSICVVSKPLNGTDFAAGVASAS